MRFEPRRRIATLHALYRLVTRPYVRSHPGRAALLLVAVALGVSTVAASGNLIESAVASLESSWEIGRHQADLRISNGFAGVPEDLGEIVSGVPGVESAAAVLHVQGRVLLEKGAVDLSIVAFDLLGDTLHRSEVDWRDLDVEDEASLLTRTDAVILDRSFASRHSIAIGAALIVDLSTGRQQLHVAGLLPPMPADEAFGETVAVMDLPAAQLLLDRDNSVEFIDVKLASGADTEKVRERLASLIGDRAVVEDATRAPEEIRSLLSSVRLILGVPGWIAIVIGALVIHHAAWLAVSQRKPQLDMLRALGASRRSLVVLLLAEGLAAGALGAALGLALGLALAWLASGIVGQVVGSIYHPLTMSAVHVSPGFNVVAAVLGIAITVGAFLSPASATLEMAEALHVATPSRERWRRARRAAWIGAGMIPLGVASGWLQQAGPQGERLAAVATSGDALLLFGVGLQVPVIMVALFPWLLRRLRSSRAVSVRLAVHELMADPGRTAAVITSVLVGVAYVVITVGAVTSLRETIVGWIDETHTADLVVASSASVGLLPSGMPMPGRFAQIIAKLPKVERVGPMRLIAQPYGKRWVVIADREADLFGSLYPVSLVSGDLERARAGIRMGTGTVVSRHFAAQHGHTLGDVVEFRSPTGLVRLRIDAIIDDLSSADLGTVFVSPELLRSRWRASDATSFHVWLAPGASRKAAADSVREALRPHCDCTVLTLAQFRERIADVVDAMFYMAYALELIASLALVVAVVSFFALALGERGDHVRILHELGATRGRLLSAFLAEAGIVGLLGGVLGCFLGCAIGALLARRMVGTTMQIGGGFTVDFSLPGAVVAGTLVGAIALCLGCGLLASLPARHSEAFAASRNAGGSEEPL